MYDDGDVLLEGISDQWERQRVVLRHLCESDYLKPDGCGYWPTVLLSGDPWTGLTVEDTLNVECLGESHLPMPPEHLAYALEVYRLNAPFGRDARTMLMRWLSVFYGLDAGRARVVRRRDGQWLVALATDPWVEHVGAPLDRLPDEKPLHDMLAWLDGDVSEVALEAHHEGYGWQYADEGDHIIVYGCASPDELDEIVSEVGGGLITEPELMTVAQQ